MKGGKGLLKESQTPPFRQGVNFTQIEILVLLTGTFQVPRRMSPGTQWTFNKYLLDKQMKQKEEPKINDFTLTNSQYPSRRA